MDDKQMEIRVRFLEFVSESVDSIMEGGVSEEVAVKMFHEAITFDIKRPDDAKVQELIDAEAAAESALKGGYLRIVQTGEDDWLVDLQGECGIHRVHCVGIKFVCDCYSDVLYKPCIHSMAVGVTVARDEAANG
jgi:hypothetical protein